MASDPGVRLHEQDDAEPGADAVEEPEQDRAEGDDVAGTADEERPGRGWRLRRRRSDGEAAEPAEPAEEEQPAATEPPARKKRDREEEPAARRPSLPLIPVLAVLLVLLLAGTAFLWFTRPTPSSVGTQDYVQALEAARSEIVDLTSFDYVTLDEDIARIKSATTGDLRTEAVNQLDSQRQAITQAQAVLSTQVVGAGVTRATSSDATAVMVIQTTRKSSASQQAQVSRFRVETHLKKVGGRWLLSGVTGR